VKVLFLIEGWIAPGPRYRVLQFLPYLERQGVTCVVRALHGHRLPAWVRLPVIGPLYKGLIRSRRIFQIGDADRFDAVFLQRLSLPFTSFIERRLLARTSRVVFDYDDALFRKPDREDPTRLRVFRDVVDRAAVVVAGSRVLARAAREDAVVIPTVIDTDRYLPAATARDDLTIGWIGTHSNYVNFTSILPVLTRLLARFPQIRLEIVADFPPPFSLPRTTFRRWQADREIADLQGFDIGIMPLEDTPWNRGKCAFKLVEYMAVGIPVVGGAVGANHEVVRDGETGFLAGDPQSWETALTTLIEDEPLRRRLGAAGRKRCIDHYSVLSQQDRLLGILRDVAARR